MRGSAVQARPVAPNINKARCGFFYAFLSENKKWQILFLIFQNSNMTKCGIFEYVAKINFKMYT